MIAFIHNNTTNSLYHVYNWISVFRSNAKLIHLKWKNTRMAVGFDIVILYIYELAASFVQLLYKYWPCNKI